MKASLAKDNSAHINLRSALDEKEKYRRFLYMRGFLITDKRIKLAGYPFYEQWREIKLGQFFLYCHPYKNDYIYQQASKAFFLIGHAYDPFSMIHEEKKLLARLAESNDIWEEISNWTGIFCVGYVDQNEICFTSDAAGQQLIYYGKINGYTFISSHSQLVGDLEKLEQSDYVKRLSKIRFFHAYGYVLPGDLSPFKELKRAQCNFYVLIKNEGITIERFWPKALPKYATIREMAEIIHNNMVLISEKWPDNRTAISVTGGMDSKTTMACTNGIYDRFQYFSYNSLPDEKIDADAAHDLCKALGLFHTIYTIPTNNNEIEDFEIWNELLCYNCGYLGYAHQNDVRKRAYFAENHDFDIEVKSWVDEIGRARYHKRFAKQRFPKKLTPRYCSSIYKPFITERKLLRETDKVFRDFLAKYYDDQVLSIFPWWDLLYWEFEWNAAEGAFMTGQHVLSYDITIPFNNRRLLEMMLTFPLNMRIRDGIQKEIIHVMNPVIENTGIHVQDVSHTKKRALIERAYLEINSRLPF